MTSFLRKILSLAKEEMFNFRDTFYADNNIFLFNYHAELERSTKEIRKHFAHFRLIINTGNSLAKSMSEAILNYLKKAKELMKSIMPEDLILSNDNSFHFTLGFKYLGSIITPLLNEDKEILARIRK